MSWKPKPSLSEMSHQSVHHNAPPPPSPLVPSGFVVSVIRVDIEGLLHGNFSDADAESVLDDIEKVLLRAYCTCRKNKRSTTHSTGRSWP